MKLPFTLHIVTSSHIANTSSHIANTGVEQELQEYTTDTGILLLLWNRPPRAMVFTIFVSPVARADWGMAARALHTLADSVWGWALPAKHFPFPWLVWHKLGTILEGAVTSLRLSIQRLWHPSSVECRVPAHQAALCCWFSVMCSLCWSDILPGFTESVS